MSKLEHIIPNRSITFYSPLECSEEQLVRTGTLGTPIHAILQCYDQIYIQKNMTEREAYVDNILKNFSDKDLWKNSEEYSENMKYITQEIFSELYNFFSDTKNVVSKSEGGKPEDKLVKKVIKKAKITDNFDVYKIISELIPLENMCDTENVINFLENTQEMGQLSERKATGIKNKVNGLLKTVCSVAEKYCYKKFKENTVNDDEENLPMFSEHFNLDIYVIDNKNRVPIFSEGTGKRKKSIILMKIDDEHYETVGRLLTGRKIQREYTSNDPLILKIKMFLDEPTNAKRKYPELSSFVEEQQYEDSDDSE